VADPPHATLHTSTDGHPITVPLLDVDGLRVTYGNATAVDHVSLGVDAGEVVTLLGPSGCGKSTILRAIAGLVEPAAGRIVLDGRDLRGVPPADRQVGLMFQDYALFPHRDVLDNVAFGPRMQGRDRGSARARAREVLELVGLQDFDHRAIASLSGGEQQRVALARTLAPEPRVLLLDEPLGSLDRALRERLTLELRELFLRLGSTVITVTHDQGEAFTLADRVVLLRQGTVVQAGAPIEVWRSPADGWAARFLGFANVLPVEVRSGAVATPWGPIPVTRADGPAALVLRPSALRFDTSAVKGLAGPARFRGDHVAVPLVIDGGAALEVVVRGGNVPQAGAEVGVALDRNEVVVVDALSPLC
jgi:thiamine transport system ATP-binding protein